MGYPNHKYWPTSCWKKSQETWFFEVPHTPGLFTHKTRPVWFTLCIDDFGVKYVGKEQADYLMSGLKQFYNMEKDWKGALYYIISLDWHYAEGCVDIYMPNDAQRQLTKYEHSPPKRRQNCPYAPEPKKYGKLAQDITPKPDSLPARTSSTASRTVPRPWWPQQP